MGEFARTSAAIPTHYGDFTMHCYDMGAAAESPVAMVFGPELGDVPLIRVHSGCLTGDLFGSLRCDCGGQLRLAIQLIAEEGRGALIYLRNHEGRGIGLANKLRAYRLQDSGKDTIDANIALGLPADARTYGPAAAVLRDLGVSRIRLLTNNPDKIAALTDLGIAVVERVPLQVQANFGNFRYLATKKFRLGHKLDLIGNPTRLGIHTNARREHLERSGQRGWETQG